MQCLTKQLSSLKETVSQYVVQCGDLEDRISDFDLVKSRLEKKIAQLELAVNNKTGEIKLLQVELDDVQSCNACLEEENCLLKKKSEEISEMLLTSSDANKDKEILELKSSKKSLNSKIYSVSKEKIRLEGEIATLVDANRMLEQSLAEAEGKISKLMSKVDLLESEKTLNHLTNNGDTTDHPGIVDMEKKVEGSVKNGVSLFGELDMQFLQLQKQFQDLVTTCNCSASLPYKDKYTRKKAEQKRSPSVTRKPFQHIFDKIYATLKETTVVADRLLLQTTMDTMDAENITEGVVS